MIPENPDDRISGESVRRRMEDRNAEILQLLIGFQRTNFEFAILQRCSRQMTAAAHEAVVIPMPICVCDGCRTFTSIGPVPEHGSAQAISVPGPS